MSTIKDVAQKAGVTVTTVSRVINNRGYISQETREKVQNAMKEIGYQPNELARALSKQRTNTIGVIVPSIAHPYFSKMISHIESAATAAGYKIILYNSKEERENELKYFELFKSNRVSGIILCSGTVSVAEFLNLNIPVITIECADDLGDCNIQCDNYDGGKLATEHLFRCGCRELIHFSGVEKNIMPADRRGTAFEEICSRQGIIYHEAETTEASFHKMEYLDSIVMMLRKYPSTDGIFASSDLIAAQAIQACKIVGKQVPQDVKIVGFDDVNIASLVSPQLTSIRQPVKEMAEMAVDYIQKKSQGKDIPAKVVLPVELIQRESTASKE